MDIEHRPDLRCRAGFFSDQRAWEDKTPCEWGSPDQLQGLVQHALLQSIHLLPPQILGNDPSNGVTVQNEINLLTACDRISPSS